MHSIIFLNFFLSIGGRSAGYRSRSRHLPRQIFSGVGKSWGKAQEATRPRQQPKRCLFTIDKTSNSAFFSCIRSIAFAFTKSIKRTITGFLFNSSAVRFRLTSA